MSKYRPIVKRKIKLQRNTTTSKTGIHDRYSVTIPSKIIKSLGWKKQNQLTVREHYGKIIIRKVPKK